MFTFTFLRKLMNPKSYFKMLKLPAENLSITTSDNLENFEKSPQAPEMSSFNVIDIFFSQAPTMYLTECSGPMKSLI